MNLGFTFRQAVEAYCQNPNATKMYTIEKWNRLGVDVDYYKARKLQIYDALSYHLPQIPQIMEEAAEEFSEFRCTEEERLKKKMPLKNSTDFAEAAERNLKISNAVERKITLMKNMFFDRLDEITEEMTFTSPREAKELKRMFSDESPF